MILHQLRLSNPPLRRSSHEPEGEKHRRPDKTRIWSVRSDDGNTVKWYTDSAVNSAAASPRLVALFSYNEVTRTIRSERPASAAQAGDSIRCDSTAPQLLGVYLSMRRLRGISQQHQDQRSLRGAAGVGRNVCGVMSRAWQDRQNRRSRIRRGALEYRYRYGAQGEIEQLVVLDLRNGRALALNLEYDSFGRETQRTYRLDGAVKSRYEQGWSEIGQLLKKSWYRNGESTATRTETFTYHRLRNELERWSVEAVEGFAIEDAYGKALKAQAYTYDALGNVLSCITTFGDDKTETRTYTYSDSEQPTRRTRASVIQSGDVKPEVTDLTCDANGSLTTNAQGQTLAYTYDGQLQSVWYGEKIVSSYEYDERGRLASQWDESNQQRRVLQYNADQLCGEVWLDVENKMFKRRVLDEEAGLVVHHSELSDHGEHTRLYFILPDPQSGGGEEYVMDDKGQWQSQAIGFTPWGEAPLQRLNAMNSGVGYNAQRVDPVTGCYHLGHGYRVYDPRHQAFYQSDSLSPFGEGGLNDRAYCAGRDPVNWHDPSGHIMVSRREQAENLASLDQMIRETTPQENEPAAWWEWALLVGFTVLAVVGSIATGGALGVVFFAIAAVSFGLGAAALALRQSNPGLSEKLELASMVVGFFDLAISVIPAAGRVILKGGRFVAQGMRRMRSMIKGHVGSIARSLSRKPVLLANISRKASSRVGLVLDRKMAGVSGYRHIDQSIRVWEDTHKNVRRLVIDVHGAPSGHVLTEAGPLRASQLVELLETNGVKVRDYRKIKLHTCHSATEYDVHGSSFAKDLSYELKAEVKGYEGEMKVCKFLNEAGNPAEHIDESIFIQIHDFDEMKAMVGEETILRDWRPRKVDWLRNATNEIVVDANGVPVLRSHELFKPKTFRTAPNSYVTEVIPGDHSAEKLYRRWKKNPHAYIDPLREIEMQQALEEGGLRGAWWHWN